MKCLSQAFDNLSATYENIILIGEFNGEPNDYKSNIKNLVKQKTCFKNPEEP